MEETQPVPGNDTYVYIDVSNIRSACARSCGFEIDFVRLYEYLRAKYPGLQDVRYYEGISVGDSKKRRFFHFLESVGYTICSLERKSYLDPAEYKEFVCEGCGTANTVQILPESRKLKSNVDVYLASEMLEQSATVDDPVNLVLISCDGDYAEAIYAILRLNPKACVTVLATPMTRHNNCLSTRLRALSRELSRDNYKLDNINNIRDLIKRESPEN